VNSYRRVLGVVQQEPALFMASVGDNIRFGRSSADGEDEIPLSEVQHAADVAVAHDFISGLKKGYDAYVGEGGGTVSGGQKQRIAIARSVIRAPRVFLDDESTSALDTQSEKMLQESFASMRQEAREQGRPFTQVIVAHRLSTVKGADKIVVMEHGRIVQQGTHDELIEIVDGPYHRLYKASAVDNLDEDEDEDDDEAEDGASRGEGKGAAAVVAAMEAEDDDNDAKPEGTNAASAVEVVPVGTATGKSMEEDEKAAGSSGKIKSKGTDEDEDKEEDDLSDEQYDELLLAVAEKMPDPGSARVWEYARDEWGYMIVGFISAACNGATFPLIGYFFGDIVQGFYLDDEGLREKTTEFMVYLIVCGFAAFFAQWGQFWAFGVVGERMTRRIRVDYYAAILRCEAGFFDERKNSTGRLAARLAGDCAMVRSTLGEKFALYVQVIFSMIIGVSLAFSRSWRVSLVVIAMSPLMVVAGMLESAVLERSAAGGKASEYESSGDVAGEAVTNIRTVHAFSMHAAIYKLFADAADKSSGSLRLAAWMAGLSFGMS